MQEESGSARPRPHAPYQTATTLCRFHPLRTDCRCQRARQQTKDSSRYDPASLPNSGNPRATGLYRLHPQTSSQIPPTLLSASYPEVATIVAINEQLSKCVEVHRSVRNPVRLSNARDTKCVCLYRLPLVLQGFKKKSIRSESSKNDAQVEDPGSLPGKATTEARRRTTPSRTGDG